jgi:hypothetical protein
MDDFYQIIFVVLLYIIGAVINRIAKGKQDQAMKELATTLSLEYIEGGLMRKPRIAGTYEGRAVMIENVVRSRGRDQRTFFRVVMHSEVPIPDSIRVHNALSFGPVTDLFSEIGEFFGIHDIPFDNSVFDEKFVVRGRNEGLVQAIIDPSVQESLINISRVNLVIQDDEIIYEDEGNAPEQESRIRIILTVEDRIATRIGEVAATGYPEPEEAEEPVDGFRPKPEVEPAFAHQGTVGEKVITIDMGHRTYRVPTTDYVAERSDYYPQATSPDQMISQLRREGYYSGD